MKNENRKKLILEESPYKAIPIIAAPLVLSMIVESVYNMADAYFVSSLGPSIVAAVGINDALMAYMKAIAMCFATGAASVLSRLLGAGEQKKADMTAASVLYMAIAIMSICCAACLFFPAQLATLLGATETIRPYSVQYARIILLSAPFVAAETVAGFLLRSEGNTKMAMAGTLSGCIVNFILDPIFILPWGLDLGIAGAAAATAIGRVISSTVLLIPFIRRKTMLNISIRNFSLKWKVYKDVIKMGMPGTIRDALMTGSWVVMNHVAGGFGDAALAAITVSKKTINLVASAIMGFGHGFQPIAGFCWGAKKFRRVRESFKAATLIGWAAAVILGVLMAIFSRNLALLFADESETEVVRLAVIIITSQSLTLIPHIWGVVINGMCQAVGHPVYSTLVGLSRNFICLIPAVVIMSRLFGADGMALSQAAANILSMAICIPIVVRLMNECKKAEKSNGSEH